MSTATHTPGLRIALALEPRLLRDALAVALEEHGFVVLQTPRVTEGCDVLVTSDEDDDVVDLRAGAVIRVGDASRITSVSDLVARIVAARADDVAAD